MKIVLIRSPLNNSITSKIYKIGRGAFYAMEENCLIEYVHHVFSAYWSELRDISQDDELRKILVEVGLDADTYFAKINDPVYKEKLKANTEELIQRGGFGSPTLFLSGDDMYFGNDRLILIESLIAENPIAESTKVN